MQKKYLLGNFAWELVRSDRKTLGLQVTKDLRVVCRAPRKLSEEAAINFVVSHEGWIEKNLAKLKKRAEACQKESPISLETVRTLEKNARSVFAERVSFWAPRIGVTVQKITVKCQKTRWGSCSGKGNVNFNCLLVLAPDEVLDYVVIHELCHRVEMNHSAKFWSLVKRHCPSCETARKWLRTEGGKLLRRIEK